jgi:DNA polymerase III epsilon subunit-like protein
MQDKNGCISKNMFFTVDFVEFGALSVHGLSVEKLKTLSGGKRFEDRIDEIERDFQSADMIVSHNTSFDFMFMRHEFEKLGRVFTYKNGFCSMKSMTPVCKLPRANGLGYKYPKLSELIGYFGITESMVVSESQKIFGVLSGAHDARFDTVCVYLAMNKGFETEPVMADIKGYL